MRIAYHGTNKEAAAAIRQSGFRRGTYFAYRLEDAVAFGGNHVFICHFDDEGFRGVEDGWQFHLREHLPPSIIERMVIVKYEKEGE